MDLNFFILIEWDPKVLNAEPIRRRIDEKEREWGRLATGSGKKASIAAIARARLPEIRALLLHKQWEGQPNEERFKQEVSEARLIIDQEREEFFKTLAELVPIITSNGSLPEEKFEESVKLAPWSVSRQEIQQSIKVSIRPRKAPEKEESVMAKATFGRIQEDLELAGCKDLFDFLAKEGCPKGGPFVHRKSSIAELSKVADDAYTRLYPKKKEPINDAKRRLVGDAKAVFSLPAKRAEYEAALDRREILVLAGHMAFLAQDGKISEAAYEKLLKLGIEKGAPWELVESFLSKTAAGKYTLVKSANSPIAEMEFCLACKTFSPPKAKHCSKCAIPLIINCPKCATTAGARDTTCISCGFSISEMRHATPHLRTANSHFSSGDFTGALDSIRRSEQYWPNHPDATKLRVSIEQGRREIAELTARIDTLIEQGELDRAERALQSVQGMEKSTLQDFTDRIKKRRENIAQYCTRARAHLGAGRHDDAIAAFAQARHLGASLADLASLARQLTPAVPRKPVAASFGGAVRVDWGAAQGKGSYTYTLRRRNLTAQEASHRLVAEAITQTHYLDTSVASGHTVEYIVTCDIAGLNSLSSPASNPVTVVAEVTQLTAIPGDGCVNLSWVAPPGASEIRVTRLRNGTPSTLDSGVVLRGVPMQGLTDQEVVNETEYGYRVACVFNTLGATPAVSEGMTCRVKVRRIPSPISGLQLEFFQGQITANWPVTPGSPCLILMGEKCGPPRPGTVVDASTLSAYGKFIPLTDQGSAHFEPRGTGSFTLAIVNRIETVGVFGASAQITIEEARVTPRTIHFKLHKARFPKGYCLLFFTEDGPFTVPDLVVRKDRRRLPLRHSEGVLVKKLDPFPLSSREHRIPLNDADLEEGDVLNVLVADLSQESLIRIVKPRINSLTI